jgi:hypothetical protein
MKDPGRLVGGDDAPRRLQTIKQRHADVHQDDGWMESGRFGHRLEAVFGFCHHFDFFFTGEKHPKASANHRLVVG